ncbi:hypothetical protein EYF80_008879 [Liparis tanakae]|uniref:Uncharacterized protein n=1 Tax=Liparis tanakae TaxID=230148 RepID=A0A4Z2ITL6_9TELE|nr:hypothetical protein EYF80_008879 [Liparis tanakae]
MFYSGGVGHNLALIYLKEVTCRNTMSDSCDADLQFLQIVSDLTLFGIVGKEKREGRKEARGILGKRLEVQQAWTNPPLNFLHLRKSALPLPPWQKQMQKWRWCRLEEGRHHCYHGFDYRRYRAGSGSAHSCPNMVARWQNEACVTSSHFVPLAGFHGNYLQPVSPQKPSVIRSPRPPMERSKARAPENRKSNQLLDFLVRRVSFWRTEPAEAPRPRFLSQNT